MLLSLLSSDVPHNDVGGRQHSIPMVLTRHHTLGSRVNRNEYRPLHIVLQPEPRADPGIRLRERDGGRFARVYNGGLTV